LKRFILYSFYLFAKAIVWPAFGIYFRVKSYGKENVPKTGKLIVASNHSSYLDPMLLGSFFPRRIHYIMTSVHYQKFFLYPFCYLLDTIPIGPNLQIFAFKKTMKFLSHGEVIGIFPEGQRSREGYVLDTRKGVGVYALRGKAPVLPVAIAGAREAMPPGGIFPKPVKVKLFYGEPITFPEDTAPEAVSEKIRVELVRLLKDNGYENYLSEDERTRN
jgi:1-acyl-sn-glycerol-3-phosphate acyltransferase